MLKVDQSRFEQVISAAIESASDNRRWTNAIRKAVEQIETNPYLHMQDGALLVLSSSNEIYTANGTCQCKAYMSGQPCWHRAAARLLKRYQESND
ncbi:MAG TPA: hypothetical protein VF766_04205 [Pyrinomonadaceae bacterium]